MPRPTATGFCANSVPREFAPVMYYRCPNRPRALCGERPRAPIGNETARPAGSVEPAGRAEIGSADPFLLLTLRLYGCRLGRGRWAVGRRGSHRAEPRGGVGHGGRGTER